jgi:phage terminase large subunit-like protein
MTKSKTAKPSAKRSSKPKRQPSVDAVRASIVHPTLIDAFDTDWYYPWTLPDEARKEKCVQRAIKEGWAEWIESAEDLEAVRNGYVFDLSRDKQGKPIYWHKGQWMRYQGTGASRKLVVIYGNEESFVGYCGAGDHFCRFAESVMCHTKGEIQGKPYRFMHWQRKLVMTTFGWVNVVKNSDGNTVKHRRFREVLVEIPKKNAKALSLTELIPTPCGWKRIKDLQVGDELFDKRGQVCRVTHLHPVIRDPDTFKITFSNGQTVVCNGEHEWVTESLLTPNPMVGKRSGCPQRTGAYYHERVVSTYDIIKTLKTSQGAASHRLILHSGIECPERQLEVDPYFVGLWLGDGTTARAEITCAKDDYSHVLAMAQQCGFVVRSQLINSGGALNTNFDFHGNFSNRPPHKLKAALTRIGVLNDKHIPDEYLRASKQQRLRLLQGLMDSDGTINKNGKCLSFTTIMPGLADSVLELVSSLGIKAVLSKRTNRCQTGATCEAYKVQFHAFRDEHEVFTLPRKLNRMRIKSDLQMRTARSRHVHIKNVERIPPVDTRCITVDSPDGTFLFGHTMLPTHNSDLASIVAVYLVRADGVAKSYVYGCASDRKQAGIVYKESMNYVNASEFLREELQVVESKQKIVHIESGSFYEVVSADAYRNDGYDALGVIFDELHRQPNRKLLTVMKRSGRARPGKHLRFVTTTYGETLKGVWGEEHQKAKDQLAGRKSNYRRLVMIASAEPITVVATESVPAKSTRIPVWRLEQPVECGQVLTFDLSTGGTVSVTLTARAKRFQSFIECQPLDRPLAEFSEAEANKEWRDDAAIRRANPSVDIVFPIEDIREDLRDSVGPEAEAEAKQLSLNIISGGGRRAISGAVWQANGRHRVLMSSLLGQRCFGGGDFSFSNDLTAFWLAFPNWSHNVKYAKAVDPLIRLVGLVWVPEEGIENREEKEEIPYRAYAEAPYIGEFGYVRICPGASIDYAMVGRDIIEFCSRFKVQAIGFDPAFSQFIVEPYLLPAGLKCIVHRTGMLSMAPATKRFEELLLKKRLAHGNHPMLDHAVLGAMYRRDVQGNKMFCKDKSLTRIDPLASATMATGWACDPPVELKNSGAWSGKGTGAFG